VLPGPGPNNSFNPNPLRSTNNMANKACHVVGSTTQVGLTQALYVGSSFCSGGTVAHSHLLPSIGGDRHSSHSPGPHSLPVARSLARVGAANSRSITGPDGRRTWLSVPGFVPFAAGSGVESPPPRCRRFASDDNRPTIFAATVACHHRAGYLGV